MHRPGIKRVYVPIAGEHWQLLRVLAAERRTSMAQELAGIVRPELERMRRITARTGSPHGSADGRDTD